MATRHQRVNLGGINRSVSGLVSTARKILALAAALTAGSLVESAYAGKNVQVNHIIKGSATFHQNGSILTIRPSDRTIINYNRFDVGAGQTVRFIQPSSTSRVMNRITSADPSQIDGMIRANGIVFFVNPAGVMFGPHAVINVGQFYAAAGNITDSNFLSNINRFQATGSIVNQGVINADAVALIGRTVANAGTISAEGGLVTMVSGDDVMLGTRDGHIMVKVGSTSNSSAAPGSLANTGSVTATRTVLAGGDMYSLAIGGSIQSKHVTVHSRGAVAVTGKIDASDSSPAGAGGQIVVTGQTVNLQGANLDASGTTGGGTVLVGGNFHGQGKTPRATDTTVDNTTIINASAIHTGNGGKVVVWSDNRTTYNGSIYAKGGAISGNGGQVEVSGKGTLAFNGTADTTAPHGTTGSLLLDPHDININASNPDVHGDGSNQDVSGDILATDDGTNDSTITSGGLATLLNTTDVSLAAAHDINVNDHVDASANANSHSLALTAGHDVTLNAGIDLKNADLHLTATNRVSLGASINTHGGDAFITATADVVNPAGTLTANHLTIDAGTGIGSGSAINTAVSSLEAHTTTGDILISNTGPLNLGFTGGAENGVSADAGVITITSTGSISATEANHPVTASGDISLTSTTGNIITDNYAGAAGSGQILSTAGAVTLLSSAGDITLGQTTFGDVHAATGLTLTATLGTVTVDNASFVETDAGNAVITAGTAVQLLQTNAVGAHIWNNGTGNISISAPTFTSNCNNSVGALKTLSTGTIDIQSDTVDIQDQLTAGGRLTIRPFTTGYSISLADAPVAGQLTITGDEFSHLSASVVTIGDATSGPIALTGTVSHPAGWNTLHLITGSSVSDATGGVLSVVNLAVSAGTSVTLSTQTQSVGAYAIAADGAISLKNSGTLATGTVDSVVGVASASNNVSLTADKMDLAAPVSTVASGTLTIQNLTNHVGVDLGSATDVAASTIELSQAEISNISTGKLNILTTGGVSFSAAISATGHFSELDLNSTDAITGSSAITVPSLFASSGSTVTLDGSNAVSTLSGNSVGAFSFTDSSPLTVGTVNAVDGITTTSAGNIRLTADDLTLSKPVNADSGSAVVTLRNLTSGVTINLGAKPGGGVLGLNQADLNQITASVLRIGRNDANASGNVNLSANLTHPAGWSTLHILTGGNVSGTGSVDNIHLAVDAGGSIILNGSNAFTQFAATGSSVSLTSTNLVTVTTVDGVTGINTSPSNGSVTITDDAIDILQNINAGTGAVTLRNRQINLIINLGGADAAGILGLSSSDLSHVSAGSLVIGRNDASAASSILITTNISTSANLTLLSGGAIIVDPSIVGTALTSPTLSIAAATGIGSLAHPLTSATSNFEASDGTAGIFLANTGNLTIGGASSSFTGVHINTSGGINITNSGSISVINTGETLTSPGNVTLLANGATSDIVTAGANSIPSAAIDSTAGSVSLTAGRNVTLGSGTRGDVHAATGLTIAATLGSATADNGSFVETDAGNATITAGTSVQLLQTNAPGAHIWNNGAGNISISAPSFTSTSNAVTASLKTTATGNIDIQSDTDTFSDHLTSAGRLTFRPFTSGRSISLANAPVSSQLTLSNTELSLVSANVLTIGDATSGAISLTNSISHPAGWNTLHLITGSSVSDSTGGTLSVTNLAVSAGTSITLSTQTQSIGTFAATATGAISVKSSSLTVGTVDSVIGISTTNSDVTLTTDALTLSQAVHAGTAALNVVNLTSGQAFDLGAAAANAAGVLGLPQSQLDLVDAATLRIGSSTAGTIDVLGLTNTSGGSWTTLHLSTNSNITQTGSLTVPSLALEAGSVDLSDPANTISNLAASAGTTFSLHSTSSLTVQTVDALSNVTAHGSTLLSSDDLLTLTQNVSAGSANLLVLTGATGISQTGGAISADSLAASATTGNIDLPSLTNDINTFAATAATGHILYTDATGFDINTVNSIIGLSSNGDLTLAALNGDLTQSQLISTNGGNYLATVAGNYIGISSSSTINTIANTPPPAPSGSVTITATATGPTNGVITLVAPVDTSGLSFITGGAAGDITLTGTSLNLAALTANGGPGLGGGNGGNISLTSTTSTGSITLNADLSAAGGIGTVVNGSDGSVSLHGPVLLAQSINITGSAITFDSSLRAVTANTQGLDIYNSSTVTFSGPVGDNSQPLAYLHIHGNSTTILGGTVTTNGDQTYPGPVTLSSDTTLTGDNFTFSSTVDATTDGGESLIINNAGLVTFDGPVGSLLHQRLSSLTITGTTTGGLPITGSTDINGSSVTTTGDQTYSSDVTLSANTSLTSSTITLHNVDGDVSGPWTLSLHNSDTATLAGHIGPGDGIRFFTVDGPATITGGYVRTGAGGQTYSGALTIASDTSLNGSGSITFNSTVRDSVDGAHTLTVFLTGGAGVTVNGAIGDNSLRLSSLTLTTPSISLNGSTIDTTGAQLFGGTTTLGANTTLHSGTTVEFGNNVLPAADGAESLSVTATTLTTFNFDAGQTGNALSSLSVTGPSQINADVTTSTSQSYNGPVVMGGNNTLTGTTIHFFSTLRSASDGLANITIANSDLATFDGPVGDNNLRTGNFEVDGPALINGSSVNSAGAQNYVGPVSLADGATTLTSGTFITFFSTLDGVSNGAAALSIVNTGLATFSDNVGSSFKLLSLSISGSSFIHAGGNISTTAAQTYTGPLSLGIDTSLTASLITFSSTINDDIVPGIASLTLHNSELATFDGPVGNTNALTSLTVDGPSDINGGSVITTDNQTYSGPVTLSTYTVTPSDNTILTGHNITFSSNVDATTSGIQSLTISNTGLLTFAADVGHTSPLASLSVSGSTLISGPSVLTTGNQHYTGIVTLGNFVTLGAADISFGSTVDGVSDGVNSLSIINTGTATFNASVGSVHTLNSLFVSGAATIAGGSSINTSSTQIFGGPLSTNVNLTLNASQVFFTSTVRDISDGAHSLTISADATFHGAVGDASHRLSSLSVAGASTLDGSSINTSGFQTYTGPATLSKDNTLTANTITFNSTITGPHALILLNSGLATLDSAASLSSLSISGPSALNGPTVSTTGNQTYTGPVTLGQDSTLTSAAITFGSTLNANTPGSQSLTLDNSAVATFNGQVGNTAHLKFLHVSGNTSMNAGSVTTTQGQTYSGDTTLARTTTLTGSQINLSNVIGDSKDLNVQGIAMFNGTVNNAGDLIVTGPATFSAAVTANTVSVSDATQLNGGTIHTSGTQNYTGPATLGVDTTLSGSIITFQQTVRDSDSNATQSLTINGKAVFGGSVGDNEKSLEFLTVNGRANIGDSHQITTKGNQKYAGNVTVSNGATFHAGGNIVFQKDLALSGAVTVYGTSSLTKNSTIPGVLFNGNITGSGADTDSLDVQVPWATTTTGVVQFNNTSGATLIRKLGALTLEYPPNDKSASPTNIPNVATIAVTSKNGINITVNKAFTMGQNQKMTATNGPITIHVSNANGAATLGDLNSPDDIFVSAHNITLLYRPAGPILNTPGLDEGLNFFSGASITFTGPGGSTKVTPSNAKNQFVGFTFNKNPPATEFLNQLTQPLVLQLSKSSQFTSGDTVLDLPVNGTSIVDPSVALAGVFYLQVVQPSQEIGISEAAQSLLADFGIRTRELTQAELIDGLYGRDVYVQENESFLRVAIPRLNEQVVLQALDAYSALFSPKNGAVNRAEMQTSIHETLTKALDAYSAANPGVVDPVAFRHFVDSSPDQTLAKQYMDRLENFLNKLELLALTQKELVDAKTQVCGEVKPTAMSLGDFETAVMTTPASPASATPPAANK